ncbi:MAG: VOC family protein [Pyrinomonadaceae bacterium]|nr:VOC family protein [Pyrinomonadaceae bacterium]
MSDQASAKKQEMPKHGQICWTEVAAKNLDEADRFYTELFGWKIRSDKGQDFEYRHFDDGHGHDVGGIYELTPEMTQGHDVPPHFMTYIAVNDVDETVRLAKEKGATVHREPMDIPDTGRMAVIADPQGAVFAVITLKEQMYAE